MFKFLWRNCAAEKLYPKHQIMESLLRCTHSRTKAKNYSNQNKIVFDKHNFFLLKKIILVVDMFIVVGVFVVVVNIVVVLIIAITIAITINITFLTKYVHQFSWKVWYTLRSICLFILFGLYYKPRYWKIGLT